MEDKFQSGDIVRCKAGGPNMVVSSMGLGGGAAVLGLNVAQIPPNKWYNCTFWSEKMGTFVQWSFQEDTLELLQMVGDE